MKSSMDKQQHNRGFTLVEILLVLMLLSFFVVLFPLSSAQSQYIMNPRMEYIKTRLLAVQQSALLSKEYKTVTFTGNQMIVNGQGEEVFLTCQGTLSFNESGNVSHAMSIPCSSSNNTKTLVIQLGSGRMYVK